MRAYEILNEDKFGVPTPTPEQLAIKHKVSIEKIFQELDRGIKVEMEHTHDIDLASEIARDHLSEMPNYYTELEKMEKSVKEGNNGLSVDEGEVIDTKFAQKLGQKKGMFYNPDAAPPVSRITGKPFVRFETKILPSGTSADIIGVFDDGSAEIVGTTRKDLATILAKAYNAGGYSTEKIERVPLGDVFK